MPTPNDHSSETTGTGGESPLGVGVAGHKIGLTSRAMQMASKMTEPDYGRVYDDAIYNDGAQKLPLVGSSSRVSKWRIYDVMRAAEYAVPALEIIDYRTDFRARSPTRSQITPPSAQSSSAAVRSAQCTSLSAGSAPLCRKTALSRSRVFRRRS